jgi:pimeloyl-ACP methyl ester carboxylesterase
VSGRIVVSCIIVYVHGLWQRGAESHWLRRRLAQDLGAETRTFSYPSVAADATENARGLTQTLREIRADTLHLVGHSLGGLVIVKAFEDEAALGSLPPGRIVLMGSPLRGSRAARNFARLPFGVEIMGRGVCEELLQARERRWSVSRDLGVIAGDLGFGIGRLVGSLDGPSDGTITVEETQIAGAADRIVLGVSHTGMLFSEKVASAAGRFLRDGRF